MDVLRVLAGRVLLFVVSRAAVCAYAERGEEKLVSRHEGSPTVVYNVDKLLVIPQVPEQDGGWGGLEMQIAGFGRNPEEYAANVEEKARQLRAFQVLKEMGSATSLVDVAGAHGHNHSMLQPQTACPSPDVMYPKAFKSVKMLGAGAFGAAYLVTPQDEHCATEGSDSGPLVMKSSRGTAEKETEVSIGFCDPDIVRGLYGELISFTTSTEEVKDCVYTLMEYAPEGELTHHIPTLNTTEGARVFYETLLALSKLHEHGWVHRDMKPQNIFMVKDIHGYLHPKVGDFGLMCCGGTASNPGQCSDQSNGVYEVPRMQADQVDPLLIQCNLIAGTVGFISPGMIARAEAEVQDDLWAMGKILLQIISSGEIKLTLKERSTYSNKFKEHIVNQKELRGMDLLSPEMRDMKPLRNRPLLQTLLSTLLCSDCNGNHSLSKWHGVEATRVAMDLTRRWMVEELNFDPETVWRPAVTGLLPEACGRFYLGASGQCHSFGR